MNRGKHVCKILKEIRQQIADKNEIEYVTSECHFQGECKGTCPKCEAEVRYLESELNKRKQLGKAATIAGISFGVVGSFAANDSLAQENTPISEQKIATEIIKQDTTEIERKNDGIFHYSLMAGKIVSEMESFATKIEKQNSIPRIHFLGGIGGDVFNRGKIIKTKKYTFPIDVDIKLDDTLRKKYGFPETFKLDDDK